MMIWAFGSYQAFVSLFITVTLISFLICYQNHRIEFQKSWEWFFCGFKYIAVFAVGFIAYGLTSNWCGSITTWILPMWTICSDGRR